MTEAPANAWITETELRNRLPREGEGVTTGEVAEAIEAAVEYAQKIGGDQAVNSSTLRSAVAKFAHADVLDIIFPRDGRGSDPTAVTLRENAEALIGRYRSTQQDTDSDGQPDVPAGYAGYLEFR